MKGGQTFIPREEKAHPANAPAAPAALFTRFPWPGPFCPGELMDVANWSGSPAVSGCPINQHHIYASGT